MMRYCVVLLIVFIYKNLDCTLAQNNDTDVLRFFGFTDEFIPQGPNRKPDPKPITPSPVPDSVTTTKKPVEITPKIDPVTEIETTTTTEASTLKPIATCGQRLINHIGLITGGESTLPGDWPWHVAIYKRQNRLVQKYICGGTIVSKTRVITAGHCVVERGAVVNPERLTCKFGKHDLAGGDEGFQERNVYDISLHPNFDFTNLNNDIAILKLASMLIYTVYVQPICLWDRNELDKQYIFSKMGVIVGWGFTEQDIASTTLLTATIPVINDLDCIFSYPAFFSMFVRNTTFCAGYANGTSPCNGDSGGGMYFEKTDEDGQKRWYLRGIISLSVSRRDVKLCDPNKYTLFTDSVRYFDFIDKEMIR